MKMKNPYSVLGVPKSATEKEIKSTFRKLAKKYHPDVAFDNPEARAKFAEIYQAYDILRDRKRRVKFDRGEIDAEGNTIFKGSTDSKKQQADGFETRSKNFSQTVHPKKSNSKKSDDKGSNKSGKFGGTEKFTSHSMQSRLKLFLTIIFPASVFLPFGIWLYTVLLVSEVNFRPNVHTSIVIVSGLFAFGTWAWACYKINKIL